MKLLILLIAAAAVLALLAWGFRWKPIDAFDLKKEWKLWSARLTFGGVVTTLGSYLGLWNMMPNEVRALVPNSLLTAIGIVLLISAVVATRVKQEKLK